MTQRQPLPTIRLSTLSATCYVRRELDIHGKMHLFGASWGSTLALAYAIAHPETVQTLILRGVFLCRRADVDYFLQGNAADFALNELSTPAPGAYLDFPTAWQQFVAGIPVDDRGDVVKGLAKIFAAPRGQRQVGLLAAGEGGRLITTSGPKSAVVLESSLADNIASPANDIERGGLLRIANPNRRGRWQPCGKTALVSFGRSRR